jgi:uncharacterized repeat protein (TIGR03803 family)
MLKQETINEANDSPTIARFSSKPMSAAVPALTSSSALRSRPRKSCSAVLPVLALAALSTLLLAAARPAQAQTESILYNFTCGTDGCPPSSGVVLDKDGNLYGTTCCASGYGGIFKLTPSGTFTTIYEFCSQSGCADGAEPYGGVVLDSKGNLYGTTSDGGADNAGTVFKLTPSGTETVLYSFTCRTDGCFPSAGVVLDSKDNLYGTTIGAEGTVFKLTPSGTLTTLYTFCSEANCADGTNPSGGVALDKTGNLYGTSFYGGASGFGTVFKVTPSGKETVLHSFTPNGEDGFYPDAGVILDSKDNVYGTTISGGAIGVGTVFEVTASGTETVLHSFTGGADGISPAASLVFDKKGDLYGTTDSGGSFDLGTVFELTPKGVETTLHSFARNGTDGYYPAGKGVAIDKSGNLYGTTTYGGNFNKCGPTSTSGCGVVYKIVP